MPAQVLSKLDWSLWRMELCLWLGTFVGAALGRNVGVVGVTDFGANVVGARDVGAALFGVMLASVLSAFASIESSCRPPKQPQYKPRQKSCRVILVTLSLRPI